MLDDLSLIVVVVHFVDFYYLIKLKWVVFQRQFLKRLVILAVHLLMMSVAIYLRPMDRDQGLMEARDWQDYTRFGFEMGTIAGVLSYVVVQQGGEIKNQGFFSFLKQLVSQHQHTRVISKVVSCTIFLNPSATREQFGSLTEFWFECIMAAHNNLYSCAFNILPVTLQPQWRPTANCVVVLFVF